MSFIRSTALRASSITRAARPARYIRSVELHQPWQRAIQRRAYASSHGSHGHSKSSDLPWAASAVVATVLGTYIVYTQDLSHGGDDHGEHGDHHEQHEESAPEPKEEEPKEESKEEQSKEEKKDEEKKKDDEPKEQKKEEKSDSKDPAQSDKPDTSKEPKSTNEQSGKQEGLSNADTKHSDDTSDQSKKGEGAHETAKLKGTVDSKRPQN